MASTRESATYRTWNAMRQRCSNPHDNKYYLYGARGIKVCESWRVFAAFIANMGERPPGKTIDRINPDGDYEPTNCRWATAAEQNAHLKPRQLAPTCPQGHLRDGNILTDYRGYRSCLACRKAYLALPSTIERKRVYAQAYHQARKARLYQLI